MLGVGSNFIFIFFLGGGPKLVIGGGKKEENFQPFEAVQMNNVEQSVTKKFWK